ncbi:hypothetical protein D3C87_1757070 [compost metagenome]
MHQFAGGFQVFAASQFNGDGRQARQCRYANQHQHQPGVFVFHLGDAFHVRSFRARGEPEHQHQISPDPGVPADEDFVDDRVGRRQQTYRDAEQDGRR